MKRRGGVIPFNKEKAIRNEPFTICKKEGGIIIENSTSIMLTVSEMATYLKIPLSSAYQLVHSKGFPAKKIGRNWRIYKPKLDEWASNFAN